MFLKLFCLCVLFSIFFSEYTHAQNSSISVELSIKKSVEDDSISFICEIKNQAKDTVMVLSKPFLIQGISSHNHQIYPWPGLKFTANILYFEQKGYLFSFTGDADIRPFFNHFPPIIAIPPNNTVFMNLLLPKKYVNYFKNDDYKFWMVLTYGLKSKLDDLVNKFPELRQQYQNALVKTSNIPVSLTDSLPSIETCKSNLKISTIIWDGINYKANSSTVLFLNEK